jgi:hypothetical protein
MGDMLRMLCCWCGSCDTITTTTTGIEWSTLPQDLFLDIASHWDVATLVHKKQVCQEWKQLCTDAIDFKRTETTKKAFQTFDELNDAVKNYFGVLPHQIILTFSQRCSREDAEAIATTYGFPINKWDVSNVQDFSNLCWTNEGFNEDIG